MAEWLTRRSLFWVVLVVALLVYAQTRFWNMASAGDRANWDYIAQVIARGDVPYRDVVNIKSPLSAYIGAAAIVVTRPFGIRDIYAIRFMYILLAALTVAFTFLVALDYFTSYRLALLAASMMLAFGALLRLNGGGTSAQNADDTFRAGDAVGNNKRSPVSRRHIRDAVCFKLATGLAVCRSGGSCVLALPDKLARHESGQTSRRGSPAACYTTRLLLGGRRAQRFLSLEHSFQRNYLWPARRANDGEFL